ncbi:hypothetical protein [Merismopedia glauca]|nr:hypothetical protein [Merismopedia glauca]
MLVQKTDIFHSPHRRTTLWEGCAYDSLAAVLTASYLKLLTLGSWGNYR